MRYLSFTVLFFTAILTNVLFAQHVNNPVFDNKLQSMLSLDVPTIDVSVASSHQGDFIFLDARELEEYRVSHIKDAKYLGYNKIDRDLISQLDKSTKIVVYCSVGYRSEKITEQLRKEGFEQVYNLYGSIFEWSNRDLPLYNSDGQLTDSIHTYNRAWSKWVDNPNVVKKW